MVLPILPGSWKAVPRFNKRDRVMSMQRPHLETQGILLDIDQIRAIASDRIVKCGSGRK